MNYKTIFKWLPASLIVATFTTTLISGLTGLWIAEILGTVASFNQSNTQKDIRGFAIFIFGGLLIFFANNALLKWTRAQAVKLLNQRLKTEFLTYSIRKNHFSETLSSNKKYSMLVDDFRLITINYFTPFFDMIGYFVMSIFATAYLLYLNLPIGSLFAISSFFAMLPPWIWGSFLEKRAKNWTDSNAHFIQSARDLFSGLLTIKTYQAEKTVFENNLQRLKKSENDLQKLNFGQILISIIAEAASVIGEMLPFAFALFFVLAGSIEAGAIIAMHYARDRVAFPLRFAAQQISQMKTTSGIRKEIEQMLKENAEYVEPEIIKIEKPRIKIDELSFSYGEQEPLININKLIIPYGEKILITGDSGSGKTTLLDLIQGFLEPLTGSIRCSNQRANIDNNTGLFARIHQDPFIFHNTLKFNLTLGKEYSDEACLEVLRQVNLLDELGIDCLTKSYGENGSDLSGGQKQRVEIARALLHEKQILLVDEATSALDKKAARKVRDVLWNLPGTVIEIAHHYDLDELERFSIEHYHLINQNLI